MAGIDVGGGGRRALNQDLPLIPFIDFLLCLVAFLLITAVWNSMASIKTSALVPQQSKKEQVAPPPKPLLLHVEMSGDEEFSLVWKQGQDTISDRRVPQPRTRQSGASIADEYSYPELAKTVSEEWSLRGEHRRAADPSFDQAVLHTDDSKNFAQVIAVIDAIHSARRDALAANGSKQSVAAFNVTFAAD